MTEKVTQITPKQARGIAALLTESTIQAAAAKAGVAPKTIYKWLKQPAFSAALSKAQAQEIDAAAARLAGGLPQALDELERLITTAQSEAVRRQAVSEWITHALRLREFSDLESRIAALEGRTK